MENQVSTKQETRMGAGAIVGLILQILSDPAVREILTQILAWIADLVKNKKTQA